MNIIQKATDFDYATTTILKCADEFTPPEAKESIEQYKIGRAHV